jgi:WD40 repeat protein/energy-coupling factor transporter ATP-binding protein EcfA2
LAGAVDGVLVAQTFVEKDQRDSIRETVRRHGERLQAATPTAVIATLVAAACMPVVWSPDPLKAVVGLFGSVGSGYIGEFLRGAIDRLRSKDGAPRSEAELQQALERELLACLEANDERAAQLRADAGALLQAVRGVEAALEAASAETRHALSVAFVELGAQFEDFRGMLTQIHVRQGDQFDLLREILIKIDTRSRGKPLDVSAVPEPESDDTPPAPGPCPYMGLAAFQVEDAGWFFGREQLIAELIVRLSEKPFLAVTGHSGSGKSSVLRAGLLPAVLGGMLAWARVWTAVVLTPGARPVEELAVRVAQRGGVAAGSLLADLRDDPGRLSLAVRQALLDFPDDARLLLLVDQFEEIFTLCRDEAERRRFIQALVGLADQPNSRATVVLGVRADFLARCTEYAELKSAVQDHQVWVGPMSTTDLRRAIEGPAARAGLVLEPGLVETILADLGDGPGSLPLLSHALLETWQRRRGRKMTLAGYREAGGVRQAIAQTAETVYSELDPAQQAVAKDVFLRLTALGEGTEDTRRRASRAELLAGRNAQAVQVVLDLLVQARLISLDEDSVEVAHEALIRQWPTLRRWLTEDREGLRIHRRLTEAAAEWETLGRDSGVLYRGARLIAARDWAADHEKRLNELERQFLAASSEHERDELATARQRNRRLQALSVVLVVLLIAVVWQRQVAQGQRDLATARQLAAQAAANVDQQPLSLLLSLESLRLAPTDQARDTLLEGLLRPRHNVIGIMDHPHWVYGVVFSPDGKLLASASGDHTVRLWEAATGKPIGQPLTGHTDVVFGVAFSPDGTMIASASADHTVRLWEAATGKPVGQPFTGHTDVVFGVAFSPDGTMIASASADHTVRLWEAATGKSVGQPLTGHTDTVFGVVFSPDGKLLASASGDRTVRLWEAATGRPIGQPFTGHTDWVYGVAFSPDGKTIASASRDRTVRLWEAATGKPIGQPFTGHTDWVSRVAFSPDGKTIASAGGDRTVRLWEAATGRPIGQPFTGHTDTVGGVAFSPDGKTIASASRDRTVRLWEAATGKPIGQPFTGHTDEVYEVAFSPDGKTIASASRDQTVRLWEAATGKPIGQPFTGHTDWVYGVAFSPDGKTIASASRDQTVRLWEAATGKPIGQPLTGHTDTVFGVAFSPDGTMIASAGGDRTVRLWEAATGKPIGQPFTGHTDTVFGVAFSPDGKTIASASRDRTVRLWPVNMDAWIQHACTLAKRNLRQDEWNKFVDPNRPYVRTCPNLASGYGTPENAPGASYHLTK